MRAKIVVALAAFSAGPLAGPAGAGTGARTMSFQNETASRVVQAVPEALNNEKEVDPGDFDNDGDLDVVIAVGHGDFGQRNNKLYRNMNGMFIEVSGPPVVPGFFDPSGANNFNRDVSRNAFFRDYDLDGWIDIIVVNDANSAGDAGRTKIYINQHPGGVFSHFTEEGLERLGRDTGGAACGAVSIDADADGDFDLYVGNYPGPPQDTLYLNDGNGFFTEVTATNVPPEEGAAGDYTVDVSSADLDGDGLLDLLVSNWPSLGGPDCEVYYNDGAGADGGPGDYLYPGSVQSLGPAGTNENAMEPGDFDGDGDADVYWCNREGTTGDRILRRVGTFPWGHAIFQTLDILPPSVTTVVSRKATVSDLDGDGRLDVVVAKENAGLSRPTVLRNTTVGGVISFVDWTPAPAFPAGSLHLAWHGAVLDSNGDGDRDVFLGGWAGDHLFEQVDGASYAEAELQGGTIPDVFNQHPAAVAGTAGEGESDHYAVQTAAAGAFISAVLTGPDDYRLEVYTGARVLVASADRGGAGVEEALQAAVLLPGLYEVRVEVLSCGDAHDLDGDCAVGVTDLLALLAAWGPAPGHPADFDSSGEVAVPDLLELLASWGPGGYVLEVLTRSG